MSTIYVGGFRPFAKHAKTFNDAVNMAMDNDTIVINKSKINLTQSVEILKTLYIEGNGTTFFIPDGKLGFSVLGGNLQLNNANFELGMQNNGMVVSEKYFGTINLNKVNFEHAKTRLRETFPSLMVKAPTQGGSGCKLNMTDCQVDYIDVNNEETKLTNCVIGSFGKKQSEVLANNLIVQDELKSDNTYYSCGNQCVIEDLTTSGELNFNGNFVIGSATITIGGIDKGNHKVEYGKKAVKLFNESVNSNTISEQVPIFSAFGGQNYLTQLRVVHLNLFNDPNKQLFYQRYWFNLNKVALTVKSSNLTALNLPSVAQGGTISMEDTHDQSNWQIKKVTLSNRNSTSQLFMQSDVKEKGQIAHSQKNQEFGALAELDSMIGLSSVKKQVHDIVATAKVNAIMRKRGMQTGKGQSLHMVLAGNPGTGKTVVARLIGKALYENGVLASNKFTEIQSGDLIGEHVGETQPKTRAVVMRALDGVLFIDEAYTLAHEAGGNSFKDEAIEELLKDIEDHKDRIVCILAGYTPNMRHFFAVSNPGLKSRFANWVNFPDYTPDEMIQIMRFDLNKSKYTLQDQQTKNDLRQGILEATNHADINSGNGRLIRNILDKITRAQKARISKLPPEKIAAMSNADFKILTDSDVKEGLRANAEQSMNMNGLQGMGG